MESASTRMGFDFQKCKNNTCDNCGCELSVLAYMRDDPKQWRLRVCLACWQRGVPGVQGFKARSVFRPHKSYREGRGGVGVGGRCGEWVEGGVGRVRMKFLNTACLPTPTRSVTPELSCEKTALESPRNNTNSIKTNAKGGADTSYTGGCELTSARMQFSIWCNSE